MLQVGPSTSSWLHCYLLLEAAVGLWVLLQRPEALDFSRAKRISQKDQASEQIFTTSSAQNKRRCLRPKHPQPPAAQNLQLPAPTAEISTQVAVVEPLRAELQAQKSSLTRYTPVHPLFHVELCATNYRIKLAVSEM